MKRISLFMTTVVYLFLFIPLLFVVVMSFHPNAILSLPMPGLSLRWYQAFLGDTQLVKGLINSFGIAVMAALGAGVVGTACSLVLTRYQFPGKALFNAIVLSPMMISRIILGVALLTFLHTLHIPRGFLYLILGHVLLGTPYVVLVVSAQLQGLDKRIEEAALNLGANRIQTFFAVTLPLIMPGVVAAMMFAFTISMQDVEASMLWATPSSVTLPVRIYHMIRDELTPKINVVAVLMMVLSVGLPILAERMMVRKSGKGSGSLLVPDL